MTKLFPQQQTIANQLIDAFNHPTIYTLNQFYLSGEMGSGKTYMGSWIASQYLKTHQILLVSPSQVIPKWMEILKGFMPDVEIQLLKNTKSSLENFNPDAQLTILDHKSFYLFDSPKNPFNFKKPVFFIYDEIHTLANKGYQSLKNCLNAMFAYNDSKCLYLTGTIFNQNMENLIQLLAITHPAMIQSPDTIHFDFNQNWRQQINCEPFDSNKALKLYASQYTHHLPRFIANIWQYISVSIAIEDIQSNSVTDDDIVEQTIAPITPLKLSTEQKLFSEVVESQLLASGFDNTKAQFYISDAIDYPANTFIQKRKSSFHSTNGLKRTNQLVNGLYTSIPLMPIDFNQTSKMQALTKLLSDSSDDHFLIYATNHKICEQITESLNELGFSTLNANQYPPFEIAAQMNQAWENGTKVCVVDPTKVTTGVDLFAEQCVWFQLLPNIADIIQAQRRIRRLSSTNNSIVTYLIYKNTFQEELAKQLSNVSKFNAATYGVKQKDELAQLTGIILGELD